MVVTCDKCRKKHELELREQVKTIEGSKITQIYFTCPYCKKNYVVVYRNSRVDLLNKQIERLVSNAKANEDLTYEQAMIIAEKIRYKQRQVKKICASLYLRYHNIFMKEVR